MPDPAGSATRQPASAGATPADRDMLCEVAARFAAVDGSPEARLVLAEVLAATLQAFTGTASVRDPLLDTSPHSPEEALAVLAGLDHLRSSLAAVEATWQVLAERRIRDEDRQRDVPTRKQGQGAAHEIALARRRSPASGAFSLAAARRLVTNLPESLDRLREGRITEPAASTLATALADASPATCAAIDEQIGAAPESLQGLGERRIRAEITQAVQKLEPETSRDRAERAARARHVTMTPLDDGMARVTAVLRGIDAAAIMKGLRGEAEALRAAGARDSVRALEADLLVDAALSRVAARPTAVAAADDSDGDDSVRSDDDGESPAHESPDHENPDREALACGTTSGSRPRRSASMDVGIIITDTALLGRDDDTECAQLEGYGSIPAHIVTDTLRGSPPGHLRDSEKPHPDGEISAVYRRLYTSPSTGQLIAMESRARAFPAGLARMIRWRDVTCRTPWCNAVVRQIDHVQPYSRGGPTSFDNGQGLCVRCNLRKESGDWEFTPLSDPPPSEGSTPGGEDSAPDGAGCKGEEPDGDDPSDRSRTRTIIGRTWSSPHGAQGISRTPRLTDPRGPHR